MRAARRRLVQALHIMGELQFLQGACMRERIPPEAHAKPTHRCNDAAARTFATLEYTPLSSSHAVKARPSASICTSEPAGPMSAVSSKLWGCGEGSSGTAHHSEQPVRCVVDGDGEW
mgnify:CR=1 FL=1